MLTGNNSYAGSTTISSSGALLVGVGGDSGTLGSGNVVNNGALLFYRSGTLTVGNTITGTGPLIQVGPGIIELTGVNSYSGPTVIAAGTVAISNGQALGDRRSHPEQRHAAQYGHSGQFDEPGQARGDRQWHDRHDRCRQRHPSGPQWLTGSNGQQLRRVRRDRQHRRHRDELRHRRVPQRHAARGRGHADRRQWRALLAHRRGSLHDCRCRRPPAIQRRRWQHHSRIAGRGHGDVREWPDTARRSVFRRDRRRRTDHRWRSPRQTSTTTAAAA